jgi:hypothetical protein
MVNPATGETSLGRELGEVRQEMCNSAESESGIVRCQTERGQRERRILKEKRLAFGKGPWEHRDMPGREAQGTSKHSNEWRTTVNDGLGLKTSFFRPILCYFSELFLCHFLRASSCLRDLALRPAFPQKVIPMGVRQGCSMQ